MSRARLAAAAGLAALVVASLSIPNSHAERPLPSWSEYHGAASLSLGWQAWSRGDLRAAEAQAQRATQLQPREASARLLLCALLVAQERWQEAAASSTLLDGSKDRSADVDLLLGRIAVELGRWDEAERHFRRAVSRFPDDARGELGLALLAARGPRDWPQMKARLAAARALQPQFSAAVLPLSPGWTALADDPEFLAELGELLKQP
jgi:Flp pilus assembly protein TadD